MRMWRTYSKANRPWPVISDDPVMDYMVMEAVAAKVIEDDRRLAKEAADQNERDGWKKERSPALEALR